MNILFLHVAKTGGTSLKRMLKKSSDVNNFDHVHNGTIGRFRHGSLVSRIPLNSEAFLDYDHAFYFVRHPLDRLMSCYHYFRQGGLSQFQPDRFPADQKLQQLLLQKYPTFAQFCSSLGELADMIPHLQPITDSLKALPKPMAKQVFIGQYENFQSDIEKLFSRLGVSPGSYQLLHSNRTKTKPLDFGIDRGSREKVKRFYYADLQLFGYNM